jgi:hypothetical protein
MSTASEDGGSRNGEDADGAEEIMRNPWRCREHETKSNINTCISAGLRLSFAHLFCLIVLARAVGST